MRQPRRLLPTLAGLVLLCAAVSPIAADAPARDLSVDAAKTRVGVAKVILEVRDLRVLSGRIEGLYAIKIPMFPFKNDSGRLRIDLPGPIEDAIRGGVVLNGEGDSVEDGRRHPIRATLSQDGRLRILVDNGERTLDFSTVYRLR